MNEEQRIQKKRDKLYKEEHERCQSSQVIGEERRFKA